MVGPFDVDLNSVGRLGTAFALFINDLLSSEAARAGLLRFQLDIASQRHPERFTQFTPNSGLPSEIQLATTQELAGRPH